MLKAPSEYLIIFIVISVIFILTLVVFITIIIYRYQQNQNAYFRDLENLKSIHENAILHSQLEIQEQTFQHISREIHDNIGQKLTLAKLHLNTLNLADDKSSVQVQDSVKMIAEAINDLSDISRSMSSDILLNNGLLKALEFEITQLHKSGLYNITLTVTGEHVFFDSQKELVLFRILQEALNNIMKHADAGIIAIQLHYDENFLNLTISDNGKGFIYKGNSQQGTGLNNMQKRARTISGECQIQSQPGMGTNIKIIIPIT